VHLAAGPGAEARLYAMDFVPAAIARERERASAYAARTMGGDLLGDLVQEEVRRRERLVAIDDEAVAFAPYAPLAPYQLLLAPRRPRPRFEDGGPTGAGLLHDVLARLRGVLDEPVDVWVRTAPRGAEQFCWRIDILPRTAPDPLALGTGLHACPVAPEDAAAALRS
jgi:UDPglucose--hexose-1-phosphate uridylyltransferase